MSESFKKANINTIFLKDSKQACAEILKLIPANSIIGYGRSETLKETGILEKLRTKKYQLLDRNSADYQSENFYQLTRQSLLADRFISSSNTITVNGKIVNINKTGNRTAALIYGPQKVIIVVGKNKIVADYNEALDRIKNTAAPLNAKRIGLNTPCNKLGKCTNCSSPDRMGCSTIMIERQADPNRMTIIIVDKNLGY